MNQDREHLRLLAIFHYVLAGLAAFFGSFPLIHFFVGLAIVRGGADGPAGHVRGFGYLFMAIGGAFVLLGWTLAVLALLAARRLSDRRDRRFCLVVAGIECLFMPLGTLLGVFTILVLTRESVPALFEGAPEAGPR